MKVVVAHNRYSSNQPSGENSVVEQELEALQKAGLEVLPFLRSSDEIAGFSATQRALLPLSPVYSRSAQRDLERLWQRHRPDVLHLHNPYPLLSPWVVRTAHRLGMAVVQTVHNFRHVCVSGVFFRDGQTCHDCAGLRWAAPAVQHGCYRGSRAQSAVMATTLAVHRSTWRQVERFVALTPLMADFLRGVGINDDQLAIKPNAVADPGRHADQGEGVLFAGRLTPEKGIDLLLEAWSRFPAGTLGELRIAGDGPLRQSVIEAAGRRSDVRYLGQLDAEALRQEMRRSALIAVPSRFEEICPMVAVEAMANSRPVLGSNRGGLPWLVGSAGWTVEPESEPMANALPAAVEAAPGLAQAARLRYQEQFEPERLTRRLIAIYEAAVNARRSRGRP